VPDAERDFDNLVQELIRLMADQKLFTFVLAPSVPATNNESEQALRSPARCVVVWQACASYLTNLKTGTVLHDGIAT
jgi:hypothetical protein